MLKIPLWNALVILAALLACGEQTPTPGGAMATVPASAGAATSEPSPVTPAAEPPETPLPVPTATPGSNAANTATPANFQDQEATSEPTPAPKEDSPNKVITPLMPDDAETFASEVSDSELACMAGTADIERLIRILLGAEQPTPRQHDSTISGTPEKPRTQRKQEDWIIKMQQDIRLLLTGRPANEQHRKNAKKLYG